MRVFLVGVLLLLAVCLFLKPNAQLGLTHDEALVLWIVRDDVELTISRQGLRDLRADLSLFMARIRQAPPLYPVLLEFWEKVAGESLYAVRWLSTLCVLMGLSICVTGRDSWLLILAATPLLIYPATTAYDAALLFLLAALAWRVSNIKLRSALLSLAIITNPFAGLFLSLLIFVTSIRRKQMISWYDIPMVILLFIFIISLFDVSFKPVSLWMVSLPWIIGVVAHSMTYRHHAKAPATRHLLIPGIISLTFISGVMLNTFLLQDHLDWLSAIRQLNQRRDLTDVTITNYLAQHPLAYYQRHETVQQGISLDLGWRDFSPQEIDALLAHIDSPIWLIVLQWQGEITLIDEIGGVQFGRLR
ncbi:MAG: hypothetical protein CUN56_05395 [Phototrophicales bacterium]|nr:MAG: hypothetical protein CUN56_05395 [Phototrophicales bacterium]RMG75053.1 MAG: hypothetical protein D6711_07510 [Chloroflexota bacterium]